MKATDYKFKYLESKNPDEMHHSSVHWLSEMNFIKDELRFFQDMLKEYTMPILESKFYPKTRSLSEDLTKLTADFEKLHERMNDHKNRLYRLLENIDEPREGRIYKEEHKNLLRAFNSFSGKYNNLKQEIFAVVSEALKKQKKNRLLKY